MTSTVRTPRSGTRGRRKLSLSPIAYPIQKRTPQHRPVALDDQVKLELTLLAALPPPGNPSQILFSARKMDVFFINTEPLFLVLNRDGTPRSPYPSCPF